MQYKNRVTINDIKNFICEYYNKYGETPKKKDWKEKDGFPCSKDYLSSNFLTKEYNYNNLINDCGFEKRKPYNAKGQSITKQSLIEFIIKYKEKHSIVPCLKDWKEKDGFPCNKEYLAKNYKYNDLVSEAGFKPYSYGQRHYNVEEMLENIRKAIIKSRYFDIVKLHKNFEYIKHRDIYANLFGSFEGALLAAGIENRHKILINTFDDYKLEDPVEFLKNKFGINGDFTDEQLELISSIKDAASKYNDLRRDTMKNYISLHRCKTLFPSYTIALIAAGLNPAKVMKSRMVAHDGHICDSYGEMLVDNILNKLKVKHDIHVKYPNSGYICDFYIKDNIYIEYIGFSKITSDYLRRNYLKRLEDKQKIVDNIGGKLIIIDEVNDKTYDYIKESIS